MLTIMIIFTLTACKNATENKQEVVPDNKKSYSEEELYRPNFHFTPAKNWMNDPNGMFYHNGYYHLFFQYYPDANVWGPMHWGHAVSKDMIIWSEQPIALYPDEKGYIFSGSAVVDSNNTSGFRKGNSSPVIAMFTYHDPKGEKEETIDFQSQAIAYSLDEGQTWTKYDGNPVIKNPGIRDFRDPKIIWDTDRKQWVVVLAAGDKAMFYHSGDLKTWKYSSDFGTTISTRGGVWECPDFFPMQVEGSQETKWVLLLSINPGAPNGGSGTQYFIGDFDGKTFRLDPSFKNDLNKEQALWIDYGRDNYAGVTWANIPGTDGRKLFIGWMSNWDYAQEVPTITWRSAMTIARELQLVKTGNQYRLVSQPVRELKNHITTSVKKDDITIKEETVLIKNSEVDLSRAIIQFKIDDLKRDTYTFSLYNTEGDTIRFGLNNEEKFFFIDRTASGNIAFSEKFASGISKAPPTGDFNMLNVEIIIDKTSAELFYNNGKIVMTERFFPTAPITTFSITPEKFETEIKNITLHQLTLN